MRSSSFDIGGSRCVGALVLVAVAALAPSTLPAQSVLERPPNMAGTWTGSPGTVYFNFMHRFAASDDDSRRVSNSPTFLVGAALGGDLFAGFRYASASPLVVGIPNEWELLGRWGALDQSDGGPVDLTLQGGYNLAAESLDGELALARDFAGRLRLLAGARVFSRAFDEDETRGAWTVGATLRLTEHVALAGDYAEMFDAAEGEDAAWSAGLQLAIPYTPHTLSLHASNAATTTLQGASVGPIDARWGFEFTVPLTLSRYFGSGDGGADSGAAPAPTPGARVAAEVGMTNRLGFTPATVTIQVGETVRWTNTSDIVHTVTADPEKAADPSRVSLPEGAATFDSGNLAPGEVFEYTFTVAGEYDYICIPHELAGMVGKVIVTGPAS